MSKKSNSVNHSVVEIIGLFQVCPAEAFDKLISSGYYFHKQAPKFWKLIEKLDLFQLMVRFPDDISVLNQLVGLKQFYYYNSFYLRERQKRIISIIRYNPKPEILLKSLFICIEIGETYSQPSDYPNYSKESLEAIKIILKELLPKLKTENQRGYSVDFMQHIIDLLKIQIDMALLAEFLDAFVWSGFELITKENGKGFNLILPSDETKKDNLYILDHFKTSIKRTYKRKESQPKISEEEHFKAVDPFLKTQEGLATIFIHGATITSQPVGTTSIQVDESFFKNATSDDPELRTDAHIRMVQTFQEQNFHYQYRQAIAQVYQPNDNIDIHALHIETEPNILVSLYDVLCVSSCLIAKADQFRYFFEMPNSGSFKSIKNGFIKYLKNTIPEVSDLEANRMADKAIITELQEIEKKYPNNPFSIFFNEEAILNWCEKIVELKSKPKSELISILNLFADLNSRLPFNPLYKVDKKYYFSYTSFRLFNFNRILYDYYISDKLFNPRGKFKSEQELIDKVQINREKMFTKSIKDLLLLITPFAENGLDYSDPQCGYNFGELRGEFDVVAFFKNENVIIPIQVKLSNVSPRTEKRKAEWINNNIRAKGIDQVRKDVTLLQTKPGLRFLAEKLEINGEINKPSIYPLIVTDNFFADHVTFHYNDKGDGVNCISYFELKHLILNTKVHSNQAGWSLNKDDFPTHHLIEAIDNNIFWSFLNEKAEKFKVSKSLTAINEEYRIEMII